MNKETQDLIDKIIKDSESVLNTYSELQLVGRICGDISASGL